MITYTIAIQCHNFQKRLCWMLSSLVQQQPGDFKITVDISHMQGTGRPTTEVVADLFRQQGLSIKLTTYTDIQEFQFRGLTRNRQIEACNTDWIIFADTDMVYPFNFFTHLSTLLVTDEWAKETRCLFSDRFSTDLDATNALVDTQVYPTVIPGAWKQAKALRGHNMPSVGAGYFQLMNVKALKEQHGGYYVRPTENKDHSWLTRHQKAHSDKQFRNRVGWRPIPLLEQIHMQHVRDADVGYHLELQR